MIRAIGPAWRSAPAASCGAVETLVLTLILFVLIQTFVAQPRQIQQESMENTLLPNQYVLVDKLTPRFDSYQRGDIVVFVSLGYPRAPRPSSSG